MRYVFALISIFLLSTSGFSQKKGNQLLLGAELALPTGDFADVMKPAAGMSVKGYWVSMN